MNDIDNSGITAKSGVSWEEMGRAVGNYFARLHPLGSKPVKVAWFPGPKGAGWVKFVEAGFLSAMQGSSARIVAVKWGDTGFEIQLLLIEELLEEHPDIDYIVGSAPTADAAVSILRAQGREKQVKILADYFTHGTFGQFTGARWSPLQPTLRHCRAASPSIRRSGPSKVRSSIATSVRVSR